MKTKIRFSGGLAIGKQAKLKAKQAEQETIAKAQAERARQRGVELVRNNLAKAAPKPVKPATKVSQKSALEITAKPFKQTEAGIPVTWTNMTTGKTEIRRIPWAAFTSHPTLGRSFVEKV